MMEFLQTKKEITAWLEKHQVKGYKIIPNEKYGYVVNVSGDVDLSHRKLHHILVKFANVGGDFHCYSNKLTSLEFCPAHVGGNFSCSYNKLTSLAFCPNYVGGDFFCENNQLTSLKFCPTHVGDDFFCECNPLLKEVQDITDFNGIYQRHQETKIKLAKERLERQLSVQALISSKQISRIKI